MPLKIVPSRKNHPFKPISNVVQTIVKLAPFCMFKAVVAFGPLLKFVTLGRWEGGGGGGNLKNK